MNFNFATRPEIVGQDIKVVEEFVHNGRQAVRTSDGSTYYLNDKGEIIMPGAPVKKAADVTVQKSTDPTTKETTEVKRAESGGEVKAKIYRVFDAEGALIDEKKEGDLSLLKEGAKTGGLKMGTVLTIAAAGLGAFLLFRG